MSTDRRPTAGFIGLGNMGGAIVERMLDVGFDMHIHDSDPLKSACLVEQGAVMHPSAASVADTCHTVFGCLPSLQASEDVLFGDQGLSQGTSIRCYVEMSTIGPAAIRRFGEEAATRTIDVVDAPVSGGAEAARKGTLAIMLAAPKAVLDPLVPELMRISPRVLRVGDQIGQAQAMKLVNNLLAAANMATSFEALVLGVKLGLNAATIIDVVNVSSGRNTGMDERKTRAILTRNFSGLGKIALLDKDIALAMSLARDAGARDESFPALNGMAALWRSAVQQGMSDEDVSALIKVVERWENTIVTGTG